MSITSPIEVELQQSEIQVIDDDITVVPESAPAVTISAPESSSIWKDPLAPFLVLGTISLIAVFVIAVLLAL